jgi:hypothetical protein
MIAYQIVGALVGLGFWIVLYFIARSAWRRTNTSGSNSALKGLVLFGLVLLPVVGWIKAGAVYGALK